MRPKSEENHIGEKQNEAEVTQTDAGVLDNRALVKHVKLSNFGYHTLTL